MKSKNLIIGTVGIAALSAVFLFSPFNFFKKSASYNKSSLSSLQEQNANDAAKWLAARYVDLETGERISPEKLNQLINQEKNRKRSNLVFEELGPDNIGGRTRAIQPDRFNTNKVWAGSITGGLFYSSDAANSWNKVEDFPGAPYISSMTQTIDGTIFVATGYSNSSDQWSGNGLYYKTTTGSWQTVPGTESLSYVDEVVSSDVTNDVFFATTSGLKKWAIGQPSFTSLVIPGGNCNALAISKDGQLIVTAIGNINKIFVSTDGGANFVDKSGADETVKVPPTSGRMEIAISPTKNSSNNYSSYAIRTGGNLEGMSVSHDNGQMWSQFIGASGTPSNLDIYRDQGQYNSIVSVVPNDPEKILLGGIDIWKWKQNVNNPPAGGFEVLSQWFFSPTSALYVHADNHEMKWNANNRLYIGNDGGIGISDDYASTFYPANRGYNVTQFYGIAMDRNGSVMGGAQDNGSLYNDFSNASYKEFTEVGGGDGFECEISFFNPNVMFSTVYNNSISRIKKDNITGQFTVGSFEPPFPLSTYGPTGVEGGAHPFHTEIVLAEYYDTNSKDSITFSPKKNYTAGSKVKVASLSTGDTIMYTTPTNLYFDDTVFALPSLTRTDYKVTNVITGAIIDLGQNSYTQIYNAAGPTNPPGPNDTLLVNGVKIKVGTVTPYDHFFTKNAATQELLDLREDSIDFNISWDTIRVQDPFQSWFLVYTYAHGGELWGTRDALRLAKDPTWVLLTFKDNPSPTPDLPSNLGTGNVDIEFSKDLNYCFVSCGAKVFRIDGLGSIYSQQTDFTAAANLAGTSKKTISNSSCEGIAINPNNANDLILLQGFNGSISRSNNATATTPTFSALTGLGVAAYDAIIDRLNPQVIVVGTALGVKVSDNGGGSWMDASEGFRDVPVFEVRQNWRTWEEGCTRNGEVYLGTFGRGIWASSSLLGLYDETNEDFKSLKTNLKAYPNPTTDVSMISFNLVKTSNVTVKVYNLAGVLVKTISEKNMQKGSQTIDINASNFNNGTYIIKLEANNISETVKFIKM